MRCSVSFPRYRRCTPLSVFLFALPTPLPPSCTDRYTILHPHLIVASPNRSSFSLQSLPTIATYPAQNSRSIPSNLFVVGYLSFFPKFFFYLSFPPFFPLPAFSRSSFFRSPENSIFFTRPARPENTANPVSAQRAGEVQILGHLFSTSRTYETPFPPFPLTSMRPIATTSDRSRASLRGERFRRVDARLSTRRGRQVPTRNIRSSLV